MKQILFLFWTILLGYFPYDLVQAMVRDQPVSLNVHNAPIAQVLEIMAQQQNLNLFFYEQNPQKITVKLQHVPWQQALNHIAQLGQLDIHIQDNILIISEKKVAEAVFKIDQEEVDPEATLPLQMMIFTPSYYDIDSIIQLINQHHLLSTKGYALADTKNNQIILYDNSTRIAHIQKVIASLDKKEQQIAISAHIVSIGQDALNELGVNWGYQGNPSQTINQLGFAMPVATPTSQIGLSIAKLNGHFLDLELSALEAENHVDIIANPRLLTSNQKTASIKQGTEIPYEVSSGEGKSTKIEFKEAVLGLEVTPRILNNGLLALTLHITQNTIGQSIKQRDGGEALAIDTQEIKTEVIVKNGETLVLGGIFQRQDKKNKQSVPGISKIPIIGQLFQYQRHERKKREFIIFITPKIEIS